MISRSILARSQERAFHFLLGGAAHFLLFGVGFAGALREVGLPEVAIPAALAFFNLGVEAGQLLFVAAVFVLLAVARRLAPGPAADPFAMAARIARPAAYAVGIAAAFWLIERTLAFWA